MIATLPDAMAAARARGAVAAGLVCLGWEDARAYAEAAQEAGLPVILQAGPAARRHMPLAVWGPMLRAVAADVDVPVCAHLDHGASLAEAREAIDGGFTGVMFDGSRLPFAENVERTAAVAALARAAGVGSEGEIGVVGYAEGAASRGTDPEEAGRFADLTGVDAVAVSVGNVHLQEAAGAGLDEARLRAVAARVAVPLVIHGGSGVPAAQRRRLLGLGVGKHNVGTELRRAWGAALREAVAGGGYDRVALLGATERPMRAAARAVLEGLRGG